MIEFKTESDVACSIRLGFIWKLSCRTLFGMLLRSYPVRGACVEVPSVEAPPEEMRYPAGFGKQEGAFAILYDSLGL